MSDTKKHFLILDESFTKTLFQGEILEENLYPYEAPLKAEQENLALVVDTIDKFLKDHEHLFREFDTKGAQPTEYIDTLKELGLFGLIIPEDFGGLGLSSRSYARVLEAISYYDGSTGLTVGAHSSIGVKGLLLFGSDTQKTKYLPKLSSGEMIAAFCLTEAGSGSDAASIKTSCTEQEDGSWILNGEKVWITNGPIANFFTVFARNTADGHLNAFIVERSFSGVATGPKEDKMGIRGSATSTVVLTATPVPASNLLGEKGQGFKIAMAILNSGRTGLGGGCIGAMKRCFDLAHAQAAQRKQFGKPLLEYGLIREKLAQIKARIYATECIVGMVGSLIDNGSEDYSVEAAVSKIYGTEALWFASYEALQIAGGNGFMKEFPYERIVRDSRINLIFEGTNEILRLYISLTGLKDAGDYLKKVGRGVGGMLTNPLEGIELLGEYATRKVSHVTGIGREKFSVTSESLKPLSEILETYTARFALAVEKSLKKYGKGIMSEQLTLKRLADCAIDLTVGFAMLSHLEATGARDKDLAMASLVLQEGKRRMAQNLRRLDSNEDAYIDKVLS